MNKNETEFTTDDIEYWQCRTEDLSKENAALKTALQSRGFVDVVRQIENKKALAVHEVEK